MFDRYAQFYDTLYAEKDYEAECDYLTALFAAWHGGPVQTVLDLGCGTGGHALPLARRGYQVTGVDRSATMLENARAKAGIAPVEFLLGDVRTVDLNRTFDAAVATFLFCTLPDDLQVAGMRELGRVVKPGGIIRCLEYTRPSGGLRRAVTLLWEPWISWAYGAGFDRQTEKRAPEAGLQLFESRFVHDELIKLLGARV